MKKSIFVFILGIFCSIKLFSYTLCNSPYKTLWNEFLSSQNSHSEALQYALTDNIGNYSIHKELLENIYFRYKCPELQKSKQIDLKYRETSLGIVITIPEQESGFYEEIAINFKRNGTRVIRHPENIEAFDYIRQVGKNNQITEADSSSPVILKQDENGKFYYAPSFTETVIKLIPEVLWRPEYGTKVHVKHTIIPCPPNEILGKLQGIFNTYNQNVTSKKTLREAYRLIFQTIQDIMLICPYNTFSLEPYLILMQRLLLQNGLPPLMIKQHHLFQYYPVSFLLSDLYSSHSTALSFFNNNLQDLTNNHTIPYISCEAIILDFDGTITTTHTKGRDIFTSEELENMRKDPLRHINPTFLPFLHHCLEQGIPVKIATRGPVNNPLIINKAYREWCQQIKRKPIQSPALTENDIVGAGSSVKKGEETIKLSIENIGQDHKETVLSALINQMQEDYDIPKQEILFIDDEAVNYTSAAKLGITPLILDQYPQLHKEKVSEFDFLSLFGKTSVAHSESQNSDDDSYLPEYTIV